MEGRVISLYYQTYLKILYCFEFPLLPYKAILMDPLTFSFPARVTDTLYLQPVQRNTIGSKSSCWKKKMTPWKHSCSQLWIPHGCEVRENMTNSFLRWSWSPRNSDSQRGWGTQGEVNIIVWHSLLLGQQCMGSDGWREAGYYTPVSSVHATTPERPQGGGGVCGSNIWVIWVNHLLLSFLILIFCSFHLQWTAPHLPVLNPDSSLR